MPFGRTTQKRPNSTKYKHAQNQRLTNKVQKKVKKNAKIFGQFKKKQYLCIRFRPKNGVDPKGASNDL